MLAFIVGATTRLSAPKNPTCGCFLNSFQPANLSSVAPSARTPCATGYLSRFYNFSLKLHSQCKIECEPTSGYCYREHSTTHRSPERTPAYRNSSATTAKPTLSHASPTSMQNQGPCRNETLAISRSADPLHRVVRLPKNSLRSPARQLRSHKRFHCASLRRLNR
jgi:hypothetical protein